MSSLTTGTTRSTISVYPRSSPSVLLLMALLSLLAAITSFPGGVNAQDTAPSVSSSLVDPTAPTTTGSSLPEESIEPSTSTSQSQITSLPTSSFPTTASSNFTPPSGALTASFPANFSYASSNPYQMVALNILDIASQLPVPVYYSLANESAGTRAAICSQQVNFCAKSGCAQSGATIRDNFCNNVTMASKCTCSKGESNLVYYHWPVAVADCTNRASACNLACSSSTVSVPDRASCASECNRMLRSTCGSPGQVSANYMVGSSSDSPSLNYVQGTTGSGAAALVIRSAMVVAAAGMLLTALVLIA